MRLEPIEGRAEPLRIELLGGFRVAVGARHILDESWRLRKAAALIKLLALAPEHHLHREQVMDLLWPYLDHAAAANNLRYALHVARRTLAPPPTSPTCYLRTHGDLLTLSADMPLWVDVEAFERAVLAARRSGDPAGYEEALALYAGELLPEDRFEDWAAARRDQVRDLYLTALLELARLNELAREPERAIAALEQAIQAEPACEEASVALMRLYAATGRRHLALRRYQRLREVLRRDLDAEPDPETRGLYEQILAGRHAEAVVEPAADPRPPVGAPPSNLPAPVSSFVGRVEEIAEVSALLRTARLLTLTGVGGCGKSRLALRVTAGLVDRYTDGVWLVELAALSNPALVPGAVAAALGVRETADRPMVETLSAAVGQRRLLLLLDNCEHLAGACASLANALLRACPGLTVLATSRVRLKLTGEVVWRVPPLSVGDGVALFAERARAVAPGFALSDETCGAVAEVCRRLDGLPLALELAAARVAALSIEQITARLDDRLRLLTGGDPTALPRQQTLRAALDWSHDLLSGSERALLRRLSVFAGGFDLEAATAVANAECGMRNAESSRSPQHPMAIPHSAFRIPHSDVLDLISGLVDKSLVVADTQRDVPRYRLLETVRQYADDRLVEAGEVARTRLRHRDWFLSLAERVATDLEERPDQAGRLQRLETEHDNFRAALAWSLERGDAEVVLRLAGALLPFWLVRGYATEARGWFECGLALEGSVPALVRAKALHAAADLAQDQGDYGTARTFLSESLSLWRELGDPAGIAATLSTFANLEYQSGEYQTARTLFEESLTLARQMGQQSVTAYALSFLGNLDQIAEDFAGARARYDEAEALCVETGNTALLILARNNLGFLAYEEGRYADARAQYEANLSMADALGYTYGHVLTLGNLAHLNRKEGDYQAARSLFCDALRAARELGSRRGIAFYLGCLGMVAAAEGQMERAVRLLAADAALRRSFNGPPVPYYLQDQDQAMATVRAAFDEEAFDALWAEGAALLRDQAIAYALTSDAGPIK